MRRLALSMLPALALVAGPALSQQLQTPRSDTGVIIAAQEESQIRAAKILGAKVRSDAGEDTKDIGTIQDLLFDRDDNVVGALIGMGGFLGMGERIVAVSWDSLEKVEQDGRVSFIVKVPHEQLEQAPAFKSTEELKAAEAREQRLEELRLRSPATPATPEPVGRMNR